MPRPRQIHALAVLGITIMAGISSPRDVLAQDAAVSQTAGFLTEIQRCRGVQDAPERLMCFDRATENLPDRNDVAVVSRADVERTRRNLFGFNAQLVNPFSGDGTSADLASIEANLTSARSLGRGEMLLTLDDGSSWRKTDGTVTSFSLGRSYPVVVRRAALGSYMMKVGDNPPFRVRRE